MTPPEIRYARSSDLRIAYQVVCAGPLDVVFVPGFRLEYRSFVGDA